MNKILREKTFPSKLAIQPVQDAISPANADVSVVLASNQLNYSEKPAASITSNAASVYYLVWNQAQL